MPATEYALLVDFGSTFTKLTAVDLTAGCIADTSVSPTTLDQGIMAGLGAGLGLLSVPPARRGLDGAGDWRMRLACSSAAGGLKMVAIGLVPELTAEAAKRAALGAGARILKTYSFELNDDEVREIGELKPDIILLAGGTDGGNKAVLMANAEALSTLETDAPIVVAGNKTVAPRARDLLLAAGKDARLAENVMPRLGTLNVEPVRNLIREIFIGRIVEAKGFRQAMDFVDGILMPTPAAVLESAKLLSHGVPGMAGLGDIMVVDPGGATTDVHSVADGLPSTSGVVLRGLPEPRVKRTVEGDLGMRHSGIPLAEAMGLHSLMELTGLDAPVVQGLVAGLPSRAGVNPRTPEEFALDRALACGALEISVKRHVGTLEEAYTPFGLSYVQRGKDLTGVGAVIGSGGPVVHAADPGAIMERVLFRDDEPYVLRPKHPRLLLDKRYVLSGMGLLGLGEPKMALGILLRELSDIQPSA